MELQKRAQVKSSFLQKGFDIKEQVDLKEKEKETALQLLKAKELEERKKMEYAVKEAEYAEKEKLIRKREHLKAVTEEDRKRKEQFQSQLRNSQTVEAHENLVSKFFDRAEHQSYAARARQEIVQKYIGDKFQLAEGKSKSIEAG